MEQTTKNQKKSNIITKTIFGFIIALVTIVVLFAIGETHIAGRIIGLILTFVLYVYLIVEFSGIFPLASHAKFYYSIFAIIPFLFSSDNLFQWIVDLSSRSLNEMIRYQYTFTLGTIPMLGLIPIIIYTLIPFLIKYSKTFAMGLKQYLLLAIMIIVFTCGVKCFLYLNVGSVYFLLIIIGSGVFCDVFGWLGGALLGNKIFKKKLAPKISPNKTIEGAISAFLITWATLFIIFWFINFDHLNISKIVEIVLLPIIMPILAICGDLVFSYVKRMFKVKDYSNVIPGHGGILDRIDSIIAVITITAALFIYI